jgi:hypothetical protein
MSSEKRSHKTNRLHRALAWFKRLMRQNPEAPADPFAYVTAPKRPRHPSRSGAAVAELDE